MLTIDNYPYVSNLTNDLESYNIYYTERGLESTAYGTSVLILNYPTNKPRVRLLGYEVLKFKCRKTKKLHKGLEIDFFGGPTIYLGYDEELLIFEYSEVEILEEVYN